MAQKQVMITGGATGIGFALAQQFDRAGYQVILVGRRESVLKEAQEKLPTAWIAVADIAKAEDRKRLVATYPNLTVLVNNAGIQINADFVDETEEAISTELDINLMAPILLTRAYLPLLMAKKDAALVNVSSGLAIVPKESAAIYCASKAAMHSFTKTLRWQLEKTSVKVFELIPPLVDTAMTAGRGSGKISPETLAEEFWRAFTSNRLTIYGGKTGLLAIINRFLPGLAESMMRKG